MGDLREILLKKLQDAAAYANEQKKDSEEDISVGESLGVVPTPGVPYSLAKGAYQNALYFKCLRSTFLTLADKLKTLECNHTSEALINEVDSQTANFGEDKILESEYKHVLDEIVKATLSGTSALENLDIKHILRKPCYVHQKITRARKGY
ncbi:hypothetical protein D6825_00250 [Candidatus Woesearchaeota archaeon]|nr:MAG: hypothetical protein D6825_00250 [Candidatus Woesearchaeota archaeon]